MSAELEEHGSMHCVHLLRTVLDTLQVSEHAYACVRYHVHLLALLTVPPT